MVEQGNSSLSQSREAVLQHALQHSKQIPGILSAELSYEVVVLQVARENLLDTMRVLKNDPRFDCKLILDITVVDWLDTRNELTGSERYQAVYHVYSLNLKHRFRVKVSIPESDPKIDSIVSIWQGANFMEREAWDMYGVVFTNHPDLRRILMYDEFQGHPLRKDYPVQGKQPRIPLRSPEVRNTALDLKRSDLVQIKSRRAV